MEQGEPGIGIDVLITSVSRFVHGNLGEHSKLSYVSRPRSQILRYEYEYCVVGSDSEAPRNSCSEKAVKVDTPHQHQ